MARVRIRQTDARATTASSRARIRDITGSSSSVDDAMVRIRQITGRSQPPGLQIIGSTGPSEPLTTVRFTALAGAPVTEFTFTTLPGSFGGSIPLTVVGSDDMSIGQAVREFTIPFVDMDPGTVRIEVTARTDQGDLTGVFVHDVYSPIDLIKLADGTWRARAPLQLVVIPSPPSETFVLGTSRLGSGRLG